MATLWHAGRVLSDGDHDALIVDAEETGDGAVRMELALTTGPNKGEVVAVRGRFPHRTALDLLGEPATLRVRNGQPEVRLG